MWTLNRLSRLVKQLIAACLICIACCPSRQSAFEIITAPYLTSRGRRQCSAGGALVNRFCFLEQMIRLSLLLTCYLHTIASLTDSILAVMLKFTKLQGLVRLVSVRTCAANVTSVGVAVPDPMGAAMESSSKAKQGSQQSQIVEPVHCTNGSRELKQLLDKYDNFLLDCDGVLWKTDHVTRLPRVAEAIAKLREHNKKLLFVSNNSMHSRESYSRKFTNFAGFDVPSDDIFTVTHAVALYLKHILKVTGKCYIIGGPGTAQELDALGIEHIGLGPDKDPISGDPNELKKQYLDPAVEVVLVAFDPHFSYNKLYKAGSYLEDKSCHYVATNVVEGSFKLGPRSRQPVTGALVAAVNVASHREPLTIGKPHKHLMDCILMEHPKMNLSRTLMVGDALKTDIAFAHEAGIDSALVLTGASSRDDVERMLKLKSSSYIPTYIVDKFSDFADV